MAKGRQKAEWERAAMISAFVANPNRDIKKHPEPIEAWELNPYADGPSPKKKRPKIKIPVSCLKGLCK